MDYKSFLESKQKKHIHSGFNIDESELNTALFPFQKFIVKKALAAGKYAIFADCGLGKTLMQLEWANQVNIYTQKPVLILCPLAVSGQTIQEGIKFNINVSRYDGNSQNIQIINYEQIENIDCSKFGGIVLDECFPPDTLIDVFNINKSLTKRYIKDIKIGDKIFNTYGEDNVKQLYKRRINRAVHIKVKTGGIYCSENHPFFTLHGWKCAQDLRQGDYIMETETAVRMVRENFFPKICSTKEAKILQSILFSEMENENTRNHCKSPQSRSSKKERIKEEHVASEWKSISKKRISKNNGIESYEQSRNTKEGIINIACNEAQTFRAWGEWSGDDITTANNEGCIVRKLDTGISYITGKTKTRFANMLQSRLRQSRFKNSDRNRRWQSLQQEKIRQEKRCSSGFVRVESAEILEQGHPELEKYRDADGYIYFYDIKAERHPSFSVNGLLVHNSSILKNFTGKYKKQIIEKFKNTPYKLACTATPAPNDLNEIGNHSEFLDVMDSTDMRMRWFIRDEGMNNYRLKKHAHAEFFGWIASWASALRNPSDIGFNQDSYSLPPLNYLELRVETEKRDNGKLFNDGIVNATNFNKELRLTINKRMSEVANIVNSSSEPFIIWVNQNIEADYIKKLIPEGVEVRGNESSEIKEKKLLGFANGDFRVLITKKKIGQFGLNYQHCNNQIFAAMDFSFEALYQAIRRSYRFGQKKQVNIYLITTDTMSNVIDIINKKQKEFDNMMTKITKEINKTNYSLSTDYNFKENKTKDYHIINADCVDYMKIMPENSVHLSIFSPPFSTLYTYSDNLRDMGNCADNTEFLKQSVYMLKELYRIMKPGRLVCVHTKDLAIYKNSSGYTGLYDFTGDYHRLMESVGFKYHSKITIWTDPVLEMQRTKTQRLLYKQVTTDSSYSGIGCPEYVTIFRKWEGDEEGWEAITNLNKDNFDLDTWQKWASPVWMDILRTDVLNDHRGARDIKDEKHICPLQLGVIERCIALWSNPNDIIFSPFAGIGSEIYQAVKMGRYGIGIELKESYYNTAIKNLELLMETKKQMNLLTEDECSLKPIA